MDLVKKELRDYTTGNIDFNRPEAIIPQMLKESPSSPLYAGLLGKAIAGGMIQAFAGSRQNFEPVRSLGGIVRLVENEEVEAVILDESCLDQPVADAVKRIRATGKPCKIILIQSGHRSTQSELFSNENIDHILRSDTSAERLFQRIAKNLGLRVLQASDGKAGELCERFLQLTSGWPDFGSAYDAFEGLSLRHPEQQLQAGRNNDEQRPFLRNGQVRPYCINGQPLFWQPVEDILQASPARQAFEQKEKIVLHKVAPPVMAVVDRDRHFVGPSHLVVVPRAGAPLGPACILLNSRVIDFYLHKVFTPPTLSGRASPWVRPLDIKGLPLPPSLLQKGMPAYKEELLEIDLLLKSGAGLKHPRVQELMKNFNNLAFGWFKFSKGDIALLEELHF